MTSLPRKAKMADLINYRLRVVLVDGRHLSGQLMAFDKFMNLVLSDTQEFRATKKSLKAARTSKLSGSEVVPPIREERRTLGLVILRGEHVVSISVEAGPSNADPAARLTGSLGNSNTASSFSAGTASAASQSQGFAKPINRPARNPLQGPARTSATAFFGGGNGAPGSGNAPPGFQPPPGFGGR